MNIKADTIARTIVLLIALANQILAIYGKNKLPFVESDIYQIVSLAFTLISSAVAWWKNNSFSKNAIQADNYLKDLKKGVKI